MARLNRALWVASGLLAGAATVVMAQNATQAVPQNATQADGLHSLMVKAGKLYFGTAADVNSFNDTQYMVIMSNKSDFGMITADNSITWVGTEPTQGQFSYINADHVAETATGNGQMMRCHALAWHKALPSWVSDGTWTNETLTAVMQAHISNVVTHFKGLCYAWDVVNEAVDDYRAPGYRESVFYKTIGKAYIALAFSTAAAADEDAKLYYNDYNLENSPEKAAAVVKIVTDVQALGIKIDGVGLEGHQVVGATPNRTSLADTLRKFAALGLEVAWTEIEIRHTQLPANESALEQQAQDYAAMVGACLDVRECVGVTVWQFTDKYNWVPQSFQTEGDACLWSKDYQRRPAYDAIVELLRATIRNGTSPAKTPPSRPTPGAKSAAGRLSMSSMGGFLGVALSVWLLR